MGGVDRWAEAWEGEHVHDAERWLLTRRERGNPLRRSAADLERWHDEGRRGVRPQGRLRRHTRPETSALTRAWGAPVGRALIDPDGRPDGR